MKIFILIISLLIPIYTMAMDTEYLKYYQTSDIVPNGKKPRYAAYITNNNPCIFIKSIQEGSTKEFCDMGNSKLNLKRDFPTIYPINIRLSGSSLYFTVAAPWNEQKCEIFFPEKSITCTPTGN